MQGVSRLQMYLLRVMYLLVELCWKNYGYWYLPCRYGWNPGWQQQ